MHVPGCNALLAIVTVSIMVTPQEPDQTAPITETDLRAHMFALAGDDTEGRAIGSEGYLRAARYVIDRLTSAGIQPGWRDPSGEMQWLQPVPLDSVSVDGHLKCFNVIGLIPGTDRDLADEIVIISAHLDHLGRQGEDVYNGANDDASGCATALEIMEAIAGQHARRPVMVLLTTGEESGHIGSQYFVANPGVPRDEIAAAVTFEHLGRPPSKGPGLEVFAPRIFWNDIRPAVRTAGERPLPMMTPERDQSGKVRGSDTYSFFTAEIPVVLLGGGYFEEYHKPEDDPELIDFGYLLNSTRIAYAIVWALADGRNPSGRPVPN